MSGKRAWIIYTLLRLVFFVVPFAVILLLLPPEYRVGLSWGIVFAAGCAGLISLALSILFLSKLRAQAAGAVAQWRKSTHGTDDSDVEDAYVAETEAAPAAVADPHTAANDAEQR